MSKCSAHEDAACEYMTRLAPDITTENTKCTHRARNIHFDKNLLSIVQDSVATEAYLMLKELQELSMQLASERAASPAPLVSLGADVLQAVSVEQNTEADSIVDAMKHGWRPVVLGKAAPCVMDVPWLRSFDAILSEMGFDLDAGSDAGPQTIRMVRSTFLCDWSPLPLQLPLQLEVAAVVAL